jgi:hypothetical protein
MWGHLLTLFLHAHFLVCLDCLLFCCFVRTCVSFFSVFFFFLLFFHLCFLVVATQGAVRKVYNARCTTLANRGAWRGEGGCVALFRGWGGGGGRPAPPFTLAVLSLSATTLRLLSRGVVGAAGKGNVREYNFDPTRDLVMTPKLVAASKYYMVVSMSILLASVVLLIVETLPKYRLRDETNCVFWSNGTTYVSILFVRASVPLQLEGKHFTRVCAFLDGYFFRAICQIIIEA